MAGAGVQAMIDVQVTNEQSSLSVDFERLQRAVTSVLSAAGVERATVSVAVVDDPTIHRVNVEFLGHDFPTDVLSFALAPELSNLEGEIIVSADTAMQSASRFDWSAEDEILLYVIHGALHLVGYDDQTPDALRDMRTEERRHLAAFGLEPRYD